MTRLLGMLALAQATLAAQTSRTFDYVIVGGGPAGLLVANRLSAHADVTVAIIEAGDSAYDNPNVTFVPTSIAEFSPGIGTSIDWKYTSVPQKYAGDRTLQYIAGKALGGSTTVNGMTYLRAEKVQIDAWETLGNDDWTWDSLWPYYLANEYFHEPSEEQRTNGATFDNAAHGRKGEVDVGFTPYLTGQGAFGIFAETSKALGYPLNNDMNSGTMRGTSTWPMMLKPDEKIREDAARAFYWDISSRSNLHVLLNTTATRILWKDETCQTGVVASGVEVVSSTGSVDVIQARKEVILAAGSIKSPAILEQSGAGNAQLLKSLGIKQVVNLPGLGSNLQDQPANGIAYASSKNWTGYGTFATYLTASDLFGTELATITKELRANTSAYAATIIADYVPDGTNQHAQERLLNHQIDLIFTPDSTVPLAEILWFPYQTTIAAQYWNLLPLSRGSIHINSTNATTQPSLNPNFFQLPIDLYVQAAIATRIREFFATPPLSQYVTAEVAPGFETVPLNATWSDPAWYAWIKSTHSSNSHPLSTCAMFSEELGGVVDTAGKVYGTGNVRVVDASVFPTQISGHLTASVYAVAGKIVDAMLGKM